VLTVIGIQQGEGIAVSDTDDPPGQHGRMLGCMAGLLARRSDEQCRASNQRKPD
jgi:hypothetical protein